MAYIISGYLQQRNWRDHHSNRCSGRLRSSRLETYPTGLMQQHQSKCCPGPKQFLCQSELRGSITFLKINNCQWFIWLVDYKKKCHQYLRLPKVIYNPKLQLTCAQVGPRKRQFLHHACVQPVGCQGELVCRWKSQGRFGLWNHFGFTNIIDNQSGIVKLRMFFFPITLASYWISADVWELLETTVVSRAMCFLLPPRQTTSSKECPSHGPSAACKRRRWLR